MGLLVIQDMPSMQTEVTDNKPSPKREPLFTSLEMSLTHCLLSIEQAEWERQLELMIEQHRSFPSIYTWVIYNEGWGQLAWNPETYLAPMVKALDPTRLVDATSGWRDSGSGDFSDNHHVSLPSFK
jgi:beta-galactosidase/beta-glucuronidase